MSLRDCDQPKVEGQYESHGLKSPLEWAHAPIAAAVPLLVAIERTSFLPGPDPHPRAPLALQLPLLI